MTEPLRPSCSVSKTVAPLPRISLVLVPLCGVYPLQYGLALTMKYFWRIIYSKPLQHYEKRLFLPRYDKPVAAGYLAGTEIKCCVTVFFSGRRYSQYASNIVESLNHTFFHTGIWELPILDVVNEIWHSPMALQFKRHQEANSCQLLFTKLCNTEAEISQIWA